MELFEYCCDPDKSYCTETEYCDDRGGNGFSETAEKTGLNLNDTAKEVRNADTKHSFHTVSNSFLISGSLIDVDAEERSSEYVSKYTKGKSK